MLYSKNGSIPKPQTDGTEGWVEVPDEPTAPEGKEVVWWSPPGWVVRDPMPVKEGFSYSWSQTEEKWVEHENITVTDTITISDTGAAQPTIDVTANDSITLTSSSADTITLSTAADTITLDIPAAE